MSEWATKRFWKNASVESVGDEAFEVKLDGRSLRTPAKALLHVPTQPLAQAIAEEWRAQGEKIDPRTMPVTRTANSALDKVAHQKVEVADLIAAYGETDLLCYRAIGPEELIARQADQWDPYLAWAADSLGAPLNVGTGVMHVAQSAQSVEKLAEHVHAMDPWRLAAFHDLVALSGSLVLALAVIHEKAPVDELWQVSRLDELWQIECWGEDEEATELAKQKAQAFVEAADFYRLVTA